MLAVQTLPTGSGAAAAALGGRVGSTMRLHASSSARHAASFPSLTRRSGRLVLARAADEDPEAALDARLAKLRQAKGATPYNQGVKAKKAGASSEQAAPAAAKPEYNWDGETVYYEGAPHRGDLAVNLALGITLLWLPLTIAAVGRAAFVKYRFTDRRLSVQTTAPWKSEQTDVAYQEVKEVRSVGRGVGLWGDMVVVLNDDSKVEMRSVDRFMELKEYILKRRDELAPPSARKKPMGAELTQAELLGEDAASKKGFASSKP